MTNNPDLSKLHPHLRAFLEQVEEIGDPPLYMFPPEEARRRYLEGILKVRGDLPKEVQTSDRTLAGSGGDLAIRIYRPICASESLLPVLVYFHGGGWSFGNIDTHDHVCRYLAIHSDSAIVSVDYRLAPEHKFPAAVEDAVTVTKWVADNADALSIDKTRLAVGGDSAGGTLAAVTCLLARDRGGPHIAYQLLIYPATDMKMDCASHRTYGEGFRLTQPLMTWCTTNYMRDGRDFLDPQASPLLAPDFSNLPPAHIITAGFDPLQDEGKAYADRLRAAKVPVRHDHNANMIHGFIGMTGFLDTARDALMKMGAHLKAHFDGAA